MLNIHQTCAEHLQQVSEFARSVGAHERLQKQLNWLANYACKDDPQRTRCTLYKDFAPYSFEFMMERRAADGGYEYWFNGGLIYNGPGQPLDGGQPALSVHVNPGQLAEHDWSVHS